MLAAEVLNGIRSDNWPDPGQPAPPPRPPRASGRAAGPRPLHSVDLSPRAGAGPQHGTGPDRGDGLGQRDQFG